MEPFHRAILSLGIGDRVVFRPEWVDKEDVHLWFAACDLVVLPYTHLFQSAVVTQACAFGRPVVATRVGNLPEVITDGETGWIVEPRDPVALSRALDEALNDPDEASRRGREACSRTRQILQVLQAPVAGPGRP